MSLLFQYCQKIVVFSHDFSEVLLCKRKGEADYDGIYSFIGGKMETTDESILAGLQREKNEEVGQNFKIQLFPTFSTNLLFRKKDGNAMVLPHYLALYESGDIQLNHEYSDYKWVKIQDLLTFEPKIPNIPETVHTLLRLKDKITKEEYILL